MTMTDRLAIADLARDLPPVAVLVIGAAMLLLALGVAWLMYDVEDDPHDAEK